MRHPPPPGMRGPPFAPPHPPHPPRRPPPPGFRGIPPRPPRLPPGPLPPPSARRFPPRPMFPGPHGPPLLPLPPGPPMMDGPHARLRRPPGPPGGPPFMPFGPMDPMMKKWNVNNQMNSQPAVKKLRKAKNPWITEDILILIEQRKKAYNSKTAEGRKKFLALKNEVTKRSRKAKELWMEKQKEKEGGEKKTEGENVTANGSSTEKTDNETEAAVKEEGKDGDVTTDGTDISNVEPIVKVEIPA
ncbi:neural Wiskott-Aldrich syndrome protein-like [Nilaparvata lugens]|uniref:neural Wiskott-Aldrich syndrome protein-like n=1 Tax=Nilaparvata lugens TaxID=108931 RepID=UPI00193E670B|nr:neural Wiskott-Aldrich syndrome protein-like [Nilaparvata lugens]